MDERHFLQALNDELHAAEPRLDNESDFFRSAVLVPLVKKEDGLHILFEVRSTKLTWQPGEICFPGGKIEPQDQSPLAAAIRETAEELAISRDRISMLGPLPYLASPIGVMVFPFAGFLSVADIHPSSDEVAECFTVPLSYLLQAEPVVGHMEMATRPLADVPLELLPSGYSKSWRRRITYPVRFYQYKEYVIWGLTGQVLYTFLEICRKL